MPPEQRSDAVSRASARVPVAWRNGGGWTSTVAGAPPAATMDDFDWRVSIATIAGDSAFSEFAGIDRYLVPLSAAGLDLTIDGTLQHISQYEVCAFPGESLVSSTGSAESSDDLNLMLRRRDGFPPGRASHRPVIGDAGTRRERPGRRPRGRGRDRRRARHGLPCPGPPRRHAGRAGTVPDAPRRGHRGPRIHGGQEHPFGAGHHCHLIQPGRSVAVGWSGEDLVGAVSVRWPPESLRVDESGGPDLW
ncbi:hypothetical protein E3O35_13490 [Cryobacterium sp. MDB2-A-2]|nr:hypothetical protein E3O39_08140 [Cryobacterium sp. MDB2-A-1]TFC09941.1 hypothetical protein E3O35_13490 [Cryobacterium sp. MDB2-A-2]